MAPKEEAAPASHVYIESVEHGWIPALQLKAHNGKATVRAPAFRTEQEMLWCGDQDKQKYGETQLLDLNDYPNKVLPMQNVDVNGRLEDYKDMVELPFLHEAAILYNLKARHINEKPYTRTGDIVIAVNPYQWLDGLYSEKKHTYYSNRLVWEPSDRDPRGVMEPHVYEVSALSYKGLAYDGEDQSILVSGESGAGKTETVKICLNHIASTQRGQVPEGYYDDAAFDPVVQRVVESNPLLEAFGNAKTRRNDNSSRFGKYLQLQFDKNAKAEYGIKSARCGLVGSKCEVYLLEKNRVISHDPAERTFHIFYQLLAAPDHEKTRFWSRLRGTNCESFAYVGHSKTTKIEGKSDAEHFQHTVESLELVGIKGQKLDNLMKAICIVLQLGNLGFDGDADTSQVTTETELGDLAALMNISEKDLTLAFTERTMKTRNEVYKVPLNAEAAKDACDAFAKEAYQKTFLWLVNEINGATCATNDEDKTYGIVGLLDIFGFEAFKTNRFEQLCINYANEKLQQKFTEDIFRNVQEEYESEGIDLQDIWYDDNTDVLDLIEGRTGLLALLNEECVRPQGNDQAFVQKALEINKTSPCLMVHKTDRLSFGIQHYAGRVMYDAEFFVTRNQDTLPTDLQQCAEKCFNPIISSPRSDPTVTHSENPRMAIKRSNSNISALTVWSKYKNQLHTLMTDLRKTRSRYIRCIKPNSKKQPTLLEHNPVIDQLRCAGVVAGITISRSVFPNRLDNAIVLARYSNMWDMHNYPSKKTSDMSPGQKRAEDCKALMTGALKPKEIIENGRTVQAFVVGKTRTYFRAGALEWLESNRMHGLDAQAMTIQKYARGWLVRNKDKNANQRRRFEEAERERIQQEEEAHRARLAKESEARRTESEKETEALHAQIARLKEKMTESDSETKAAIGGLMDQKAEIEKECDELKEKTSEDARKAALEPKKILARQDKKLQEAMKLIDYLKKENKKLQLEQDKYSEKNGNFKANADRLTECMTNLGDTFEEESEETDRISGKNLSLKDRIDNAKVENKDLKSEVQKMQEQYMEQAQARLELQKTLARMLTLIQEGSKDADIVEETVVIALGAETEAKAEMSSLDTETSEPGLIYSDVSESSD